MNGRHNNQYLREGNVVSSQSKVEKAKYVHTENNLRKTLLNISESFRRTNKKLSDETEAIRGELNKLRHSVEKVRLEKQRRITGECLSSRRPHRAERLLCDEMFIKQEPSNDCQKFVYKRKLLKEKEKYLIPLQLEENRSRVTKRATRESSDELQPWKHPDIPLENQTHHTTSKIAATVSEGKAVQPVSFCYISNSLVRHKPENAQPLNRKGNMNSPRLIPRIPICDAVEIEVCEKELRSFRLETKQCNSHHLPPLERIPETVEPTEGCPSYLK